MYMNCPANKRGFIRRVSNKYIDRKFFRRFNLKLKRRTFCKKTYFKNHQRTTLSMLIDEL